ncbi:MAG TPA: choice-of-anchor B family protein, partial [Rhodothermia bacterium]
PPVEFQETVRYDGIFSAHNIVINEDTGFAYTVGNSAGGETCGGGSHIINVQDPVNPVFAGCFAHITTGNAGTGYTHDAQCVTYKGPDERFTGHEICFAANENAISIADVTDKQNTRALARGDYPNPGYTHQGWLSEDHRHFFLNDELDEINGTTDGTRTLIWDVAELDDPVLVNEYVSSNKASDHNLYVRGQYMYQSNYVSGIRVVDVSKVEAPVEEGHFDTVPWGTDKPGFGGSWSNFPFFKSGLIIATSGEEGLFILKRSEVDS